MKIPKGTGQRRLLAIRENRLIERYAVGVNQKILFRIENKFIDWRKFNHQNDLVYAYSSQKKKT